MNDQTAIELLKERTKLQKEIRNATYRVLEIELHIKEAARKGRKVHRVIRHESPDHSCQICGECSSATADIWYPNDAEHDTKATRYIRICYGCVREIQLELTSP